MDEILIELVEATEAFNAANPLSAVDEFESTDELKRYWVALDNAKAYLNSKNEILSRNESEHESIEMAQYLSNLPPTMIE